MGSQRVGVLLVALVALSHVHQGLAQRRGGGLGRLLTRGVGAAASLALAGVAANFVTGLVNGRGRRRNRRRFRDNYAYESDYGRLGGLGYRDDVYGGRGGYGGEVYSSGHSHGVHSHGHEGAVYPAAGRVGTRRRVTEYETTYNAPIVSSGHGSGHYFGSSAYGYPY